MPIDCRLKDVLYSGNFCRSETERVDDVIMMGIIILQDTVNVNDEKFIKVLSITRCVAKKCHTC